MSLNGSGATDASQSAKFQFRIICHSSVDTSNSMLQSIDDTVLKPELM